jgi:pimeloyl-ACP methyl ester carboxylesterase
MRARLFAALWVLLAPPALAMPGTAAVWAQVGEEVLVGATGVRETRWVRERDPGGPHNRIQVHRYRGERPTRAALLYLPGTNMNGHAAIKNELHNLWLYLARRGVEVWALDYRTHFVAATSSPDSSPDSPREESHAFMKTWTLRVFVEDARMAAALARKETGLDQVFVAGFSRGVTIAFGLACTEPSDRVAGLVVLDGTFKRQAASDRYDFEAEREALFVKGRFSTDVARGIGWENRHRLMSAAAANPDAASENPEFDSVGDEVAAILYRAWRPGALADPVHGVSRVEVLARLLDGYDRFWPAIQNVEGRSIADRPDDPHTEIDDAWGELTLPILYFGATGMGPQWILDGVYSVVESGSEDVSLHLLEGYGHLDVLVGEHSAEEVYEPISRWIAQRIPSPSPAE